MTRIAVSVVLWAALVLAQPTPAPVYGLGPFRDSSNFTWDLYGQQDTRADTWGYAEAQTGVIKFAAPPPGYQVHIIRLAGDFIAWIRSLPGDTATPAESAAGVLIGYETGVPIGSYGCDWCATLVPLYRQAAVTAAQPYTRITYEFGDFDLVGAELHIVVASWLNTTGKRIHCEPTFNITWGYTQESPAKARPRIQAIKR